MKAEEERIIQFFSPINGSLSIWDHPNFKSSVTLPDDYRPITRPEEGIELIRFGRLTEEQLMVLKVVGDAMCANENQLRRYLSKKISASVTSSHLKYMRKYGLVERHKCRLAFLEEDGEEQIRPPAPFTLGIGGYKLLNHYYSGSFFASPDSWYQDSMKVQRYVAMNELRCMAVETGNAKSWSWHPMVGGLRKYKKPFSTMLMKMDNSTVQLILERAQMSQNFLGYFRTRLEEFRYLYNRDQYLRIDGYEESKRQIVVLSVSTVSMADFIQEEIKLHTFPFPIWFIIDEWFDEKTGMESAVAQISESGIQRIKVGFLRKSHI